MAKDNTVFGDFYGVDEPTNWLHSIKDLPLTPTDKNVPTMTQYFESMSEAMAKSCSGEVVIMTQTPQLMSRYQLVENIWKNKEKPALASLFRAGTISRFLLVDYNDPTKVWEYDLENNILGRLVDLGSLLSRSPHGNETESARLFQRTACSASGLAQMPIAGDPFSDPYDLFA
jgi:hypothetical protein